MTWEKWFSQLRRYCNWQTAWLAGLLVFIFLQNLHSLDSINQDIGRHLKTGEIIWQTKSIPRTNLFSYTEPDYPFINHHWLSELVFYWLERGVGLSGLIVFKAIIITLAFALILASIPPRRWSGGLWLTVILGWLVFFDRTDVRPEVFSYLYLAIFWLIISRLRQDRNTRWLYLLPLVQVLWTNSHIYFALGPSLVLALVLEQRKYWPLLVAVSVVTLFNPNFIQGVLAPLTILQNYGYSIVENQSIFFLTDYGILGREIALFELSLVVLIVSFFYAAAKKQFRWFEFLVALIFSILAVKMLRNFGPYALVFAPIVTANFFLYPPRLNLYPPRLNLGGTASGQTKPRIIFPLVALAFIGLLIYLTVTNRFFRRFHSAKQFGWSVPAGAAGGVEFVKQNKISGPLFNNFDVGSYLIWQLYPTQKVFVDGRPEAYSVEFFEKVYKPMQTDPVAWQKYSEQYKINYIFFDHRDLTPWAQTFLTRLSHDSAWPIIYWDNSVVIFVKRNHKNASLINR